MARPVGLPALYASPSMLAAPQDQSMISIPLHTMFVSLVFSNELFVAILLLSTAVIFLAPRWMAATVYGGVGSWLIISKLTAVTSGTATEQFVVMAQMLLWLLPGIILLARTVFEPVDADHTTPGMKDPRWIVRTVEFLGRLLDGPAPPQHRGGHQPDPDPGNEQPPMPQPPAPNGPVDHEQDPSDDDHTGPIDVMRNDVQWLAGVLAPGSDRRDDDTDRP
ncbi:hypothetical protein [Natronococcus occultus]|uniref:Uncharacterized protein n=1 Tax=Natronococcus occultus SP4 TaxID=694430 RepID=L0JYI3_9EURY|nr:hypothetical protein [Natronococcus occultus]AGB36913.1 hypothetical protein Natoc_1071 [Natronococcus occultus SP4]